MPDGPERAPVRLSTTDQIVVFGRVDDPVFLPWIERHRSLLGLAGGVVACQAGRIELVVSGAPDLIDALELACSLGPAEVLVERTERWPAVEPPSKPQTVHD